MTTLKQKILSNGVQFGSNRKNYTYSMDMRAVLHNTDSSILQEIASTLWDSLRKDPPQVLYGKGVGCYPLLVAIKQHAFIVDGVNLTLLFVRDSRKNRGNFMHLVEGPRPHEVKGHTAVYVDDLFLTGSTYRKCIDLLKLDDYDLNFQGIAIAVDFWDNSRTLEAQGVPVHRVMRRHDLGFTRQDSNLPSPISKLKWRMHVHHEGNNFMPTKSMPVIVAGLLYLGNDDNSLTCYDVETGDTVWRVDSQAPALKGSVCVAQVHEGLVYWSSYDGTVQCANAATGTHVWATKVDLNLHSSPCLDPDNNRLFIGTEWDKQYNYGRGDIVALTMDGGSTLWRTPTRGMVPGTCAYSSQANAVVCGSNDFHVYVLDADTGSIRAKIPTRGEVKGRPAISADGYMAIVCSNQGHTYGIDLSTSEVVWTRRIGLDAIHSYPVIYGMYVYLTNVGNCVLCLDVATGVIKWATQLRESVAWGVTLAPNCLIAVTVDGYVVLLNKYDGRKLASANIMTLGNFQGATCYQPAAYDGRNLVIATNERGIICCALDTEELLRD